MHESLNQSGFFTARTVMADLTDDKKIEEPEEKKSEKPIDDFEPGLTISMVGQKEFTLYESPMIDTCISAKEAEVEAVEFI